MDKLKFKVHDTVKIKSSSLPDYDGLYGKVIRYQNNHLYPYIVKPIGANLTQSFFKEEELEEVKK
jgi:phosphatidylinositol kinase/protein kinase (PI-3  family)